MKLAYRIQYFISYLNYCYSHLAAGRRVTNYNKESLVKNVPIKNKLIAQELLQITGQDGFLTFSEYLHIDQFGKHGYHAKHKDFGKQPNQKKLGELIAQTAKEAGIENIIEFGPGDGTLAIEIVNAAKKQNHEIFWSGIEINAKLICKIEKSFEKNKLKKNLLNITDSVDKIDIAKKSLVIFSFSLDSVPPQMVINTKATVSHPTDIIGVTFNNDLVSEILLNKGQQKDKQLKLQNGVLSSSHYSFDLSSWKLAPNQRACVPLQAAEIITTIVKKIPKKSLVIIYDEFNFLPYSIYGNHLNFPKDLKAYARVFLNTRKLYQQTGTCLLYYPTYINTYKELLHSLGCNLTYQEKLPSYRNRTNENLGKACFCTDILAIKTLDEKPSLILAGPSFIT